jgi:serine protease Do
MLLASATLAVGSTSTPQEDESRSATATVFERYASRILKVQVVENGSAARVSTGTAFFVRADGRMLTNYHVISDWIHEPENHRVEVVATSGEIIPARPVAVDVIADLAVLQVDLATPDHFTIAPEALRQGDRLYSLGHPGDLGLSIVEGTYNGILHHTLHPKIHFTGSINYGMSGGPTITASGRVVGVNVSTMGEQRSFLVPREHASALVETTDAEGFTPPDAFLELLAEQMRAFQEASLATLFEGDVPTVEIGRFRAATEPSPIFRCWGSADRDPEKLVETLEHSCDTDDYVHVAMDQQSQFISFDHTMLRSTGLGPYRFSNYAEMVFGTDETPGGSERHVTPWSCLVRNVASDVTTMRVAYCIRRLHKLGKLYDMVVKTAVLGDGTDTLVSTLRLSGVSGENAERLARRWLEVNGWR